MSKTNSDLTAKQKAKSALVLNKVKPDASPASNTIANKENQPTQRTRG